MTHHRFTVGESSKCPVCGYTNEYHGPDGFAKCCKHLESVYHEVKEWFSYKPCKMHFHWKYDEDLNA